jgi:hypothetical protein
MIQRQPTMSAKDKSFSLLNPDQRNEKQAEIVVDTLLIGLVQTATGAALGCLFQRFCLGLHACNKKAHGCLDG